MRPHTLSDNVKLVDINDRQANLPSTRRTRIFALITFAIILASTPLAAAPVFPHLGGINELKSWFNANQGHPRLVFLLSPT